MLIQGVLQVTNIIFVLMIVKCNKLAAPVCWCCARSSYKNFIVCISQNGVAGVEIFGGIPCNTGNCRSVRKCLTS